MTKYPGWFHHEVNGDQLIIKPKQSFSPTDFRQLDPWALAYVSENKTDSKHMRVLFNVKNNEIKRDKVDVEAFIRRLSYLNINNEDLAIDFHLNEEKIVLYDEMGLFKRKGEVIDSQLRARKNNGDTQKIEKDLQLFLGNSKRMPTKTNERLGIFGADFVDLAEKHFGLIREFPTGVYKEKKARENRILATHYIDFVTLNRYGRLSLIELKINDNKLEVIAQLMDYALHFACYKSQLHPVLEKYLPNYKSNNNFVCYVVNNKYHPKFNSAFKFYIPKKNKMKFDIKKIILGYEESL